jgi:hypothetical protein
MPGIGRNHRRRPAAFLKSQRIDIFFRQPKVLVKPPPEIFGLPVVKIGSLCLTCPAKKLRQQFSGQVKVTLNFHQ